KAVRLGFLAPRYAEIGEKAFDGIVEKYLSRDDDGQLKLSGICLVAGLGGKNHRDGSLDYYFSEPVVENEAKGVAPFLLAYTEMLRRS
ncbi:MAG: glycoside hydrolase family 88 protein, partial [Lachnospiraceae bacterium]|nr:glycoside hydrolase family 88 protein [Lachnospiraceae bacterium]